MKRNAGFTLIEITVVMAIIGVLAALAIGSYKSSQIKARDTQRKNDLKQISSSLEAYYNDKGQYPISSVSYEINGCADGDTCSWGDAWVDESNTTYMVEIPSDPKDYLNYYYESDGIFYQFYARLENDLDHQVPVLADSPANYGISCGDSNCNYGVSSSNITITADRVITAD
ncbi:type II secretion system GspH family protein [Patescibacteria group bacterium]|nr:type II secretion system GspH family protein [Patescibacteria group bacterium]